MFQEIRKESLVFNVVTCHWIHRKIGRFYKDQTAKEYQIFEVWRECLDGKKNKIEGSGDFVERENERYSVSWKEIWNRCYIAADIRPIYYFTFSNLFFKGCK